MGYWTLGRSKSMIFLPITLLTSENKTMIGLTESIVICFLIFPRARNDVCMLINIKDAYSSYIASE